MVMATCHRSSSATPQVRRSTRIRHTPQRLVELPSALSELSNPTRRMRGPHRTSKPIKMPAVSISPRILSLILANPAQARELQNALANNWEDYLFDVMRSRVCMPRSPGPYSDLAKIRPYSCRKIISEDAILAGAHDCMIQSGTVTDDQPFGTCKAHYRK